jgi:hypothetical protein
MVRYLLILVVLLLQGCQSIMEGMFFPTDGVRPAEFSTREALGVPVVMRGGVRWLPTFIILRLIMHRQQSLSVFPLQTHSRTDSNHA